MVGTPKSLRQQPERIFEHYVLTRVTSPEAGVVNIPDRMFEPSLGSPSTGFSDDSISSLVPIGFDFLFDGITYKNIVVNTNGWMALADPSSAAGSIQGQLLLSSSYQNEGVNLTNSSNSVLLCPWFDDLRNVGQTAAQAGLSAESQTRLKHGYELPPITYNNVEFGVKIFYDPRSSQGRRTIVRWNSLSDYSSASTILKFEVVIYENGAIEFRYVPRRQLKLAETTSGGNFIEDATVGIFARGTNRFRDFSAGLGYRDDARQLYKYGGAIYESGFQDSGIDTFVNQFISRTYVWRLRPATHWPGLTNFGTILRFAPPKNRRRILPKNLIRDLDSRVSSPIRSFDDRKSATYISGVIVNYPTTLLRFIGDSESGVTQRQDLFLGSDNDFLVTGSIVRSAIEQFIETKYDEQAKPFSEATRLEQTFDIRNDLFFISGSGLDTGEKFDTPLWSKSQLAISLPVNYTTELFGTTASIHYYNSRAAVWTMPDNTTGASRGSDISLPTTFANGRKILEDHRGFGPIGTPYVSGSNDPSSTTGTDVNINSPYTSTDSTNALAREYSKSIESNPEYEATQDETFSLSVKQPFLIEKAVFEIPIACGPGWFNDRTTSFMPIVSTIGSFDFAGPGITVALMNQVKTGNGSRRDLIMTGTITHTNDNIRTLSFSNFPSFTDDFQLRPTGFLAYASAPGAVISQNTNPGVSGSFTGSVIVKSEALVSNGVILRVSKDMVAEPSGSYPQNRQEVLNLIDQPELTILSSSALYSLGFNVAYINNFGRGSSGFEPSGRSILGKEFCTSQGVINVNKIANPFYATGSLREQISSSLASGNRFRAISALPCIAHFKSPYLLLPGDKLVLAIAKSRPFFYTSGVGGPEVSSSISHDVQLLTGAINITLFGSLLKENREFHDTLPRNLTSPSIHEAIGNDPVLDQFEIAYRDEYIGTMIDDFVTGTFVKTAVATNQTTTVITGSRGRVFSMFNARSQATPDTSGAELLENPSKSSRLQPWWEKVGTPRVNQFHDSSERFWDSLMPSISDCFKADGTGIWLTDSVAFATTKVVPGRKVGFIIFDSQIVSNPVLLRLCNGNWTKAFPYEPRYAKIARQKLTEKSFIATQLYDGGSTTTIDPVTVSGFFIGTTTIGQSGGTFWFWFSDSNLSSTGSIGSYLTGSASPSDAIKALYGFGDLNNCQLAAGGVRAGTNHFASYREIDAAPSNNNHIFGPVIRGWKYGVYSGLPSFSRAVFRQSRFGQFRDMLEQRPYSKFYVLSSNTDRVRKDTTTRSPVHVRFFDAKGNLTRPENTTAQNLSNEATSSVPFFDGETRNRPEINQNTLNSNILSFNSDQFNNVTL